MNNNPQYQMDNHSLNSLKLMLFWCLCLRKGIFITARRLPHSDLPQGIPDVMREFYSQFAPVRINLTPLNIEFLPYTQVFTYLSNDCLAKRVNLPAFIPVAVYRGKYPIYICRHSDGTWDNSIRMNIGNNNMQILGEDIFDFIVYLSEQMSDL